QRMRAQGGVFHVGDFVPYVICRHGPDALPTANFDERAYHPRDVEALGLDVDVDWYLTKQIIPPSFRLCEVALGPDFSLAKMNEAAGLVMVGRGRMVSAELIETEEMEGLEELEELEGLVEPRQPSPEAVVRPNAS